MKILMCSVPHGSLIHTLDNKRPSIPIGILRVQIWMEKNGYTCEINDINSFRQSDEELIKNFKQVKPTVVGLSAIHSHCYPNVKRIAKILRELFPDIWIVVGGHLTGSSNVVLRKTETDICVVGEGEIPFIKLLDYFKLHPARQQIDCSALHQIKGLAFIDDNNKLKVTGYAEQLSASEIQYPDYGKLIPGLQKFGGNGELIHDFFEPIKNLVELNDLYPEQLKFYEKNKNKKSARVFISRGCVARCTFCQRAQKSYRAYASNDFEAYILKLKEKFNVGVLIFEDENFGSNKKHTYEIARIIKKHDIFWTVYGARVTSFTYEDLKFYKEHNMINVNLGIESGSQKILDIMEKKVTTKDVYNAVLNCKKTRVRTFTSNLIIGMPGETAETIIESAKFVASLRFLLGTDWHILRTHLAIAIPGTPLYEYCQQIGVIGKTLDEEEDYLLRTSGLHVFNYVNKTNSSIKEVHYWTYLYRYAGKKEYVALIIKNNKSIKNKLLQIYKQCIRSELNRLIADFRERKEFYKNKKLSQKMKRYSYLLNNFLLSLSVLFLPKAVLFPIVRMYANVMFNYYNKIHRAKEGKQKYNLFADRGVEPTGNFRLTENRIAKTSRQIDRSLRTIVMENRKIMKPAITDEEKGLQILAQGQ